MTEIPEHLLKRSKAAKSGQTGDDGGDGGTAGSSAPVAASSTPAPAAAAPAANLPDLDPPPTPAEPVPHYVEAAQGRRKIPVWVLPVIAALPVWALSFAGTMQQPEHGDILAIEAADAYVSCGGCHGANGGGGVGYALNDGEVLATFPEAIDHMVHVARGSAEIAGQEYGDPDRPGGVRVSEARGRGPMPAQTSSLSMIELEIVVYHERAVLSGEDTSSPEYQEWIEHMRETLEAGGDDTPIDLPALLQCANPEYTPGAGGQSSSDCPGPHGGGDDEA